MKRIVKGISLYLTSNIINAFIPFLLLPILTRYLTQEEYGQMGIFQVLLSVLSAFIGLNANYAASRKFYDQNVTPKISSEFNGACLQILVFSGILFLLITQIFSKEIGLSLSIPISWISISIIVSWSLFIIQFRLSQWQVRDKPKPFGLFQVSQSLLNMILSIYWVIFLSEGAQGRIDAQLTSGVIFAIASIILLYKDKIISFFSWHPTYIREILFYGIPLIPYTLGTFLLIYMDRIVITKKLGLIDASIYMLAIQLSFSITIIFDAVNKAYLSWFFEKLSSNNTIIKIKIVKYSYLCFLISLFFAIISFIFGPFFIVLIAGEKYTLAGNIIGLVCLGQAFGGMYLMVSNYLFYMKKTILLSSITLFSGMLHIILLCFSLEHYGIIAAGVSYAFSKCIQFILTWIISNRVYAMPWFQVFSK